MTRPANPDRAGTETSQRPIPNASGDVSAPAPRPRSVWNTIRGERGRTRKLRKLLVLLRPYRGRVILMFVALTLATAAALAPPYLLGKAIDVGIEGGDLDALTWITIAFVVAAAINFGGTYAQTYLTGWVGQRALADLRRRIFAHLQTLSIGFYSRNRSGVLISRLTNDVQALDSLVTDGIVTLFASTLTLVLTAGILIALDPGLALVTFLVFPVLFAASIAFRIASADAYRLTREKIALVTAYLQETLSGVRIVRAFGQEPRHQRHFSGLNDENRAANMKTVYLNAAYFPSVELLSAIATAAILLYGGNQVLDGAIQIGVLASFVFYLQSFFDPIQQLSQLYTTYQSGMAALDKIFDLLDEEPDVRDTEHAIDLPPIRGQITFDNVSFAYAAPPGAEAQADPTADARAAGDRSPGAVPKRSGDDPPRPHSSLALDRVSLDIPPGQTVALVGSTGAGKSTLAKLVARFYDPNEGRVLIDGHDLRDVRERSLRAQLGIVPQESFLFSGTIRDNIAFGADDEARAEIIEEAARAVGAHEFIERLPDGYETEVGERGAQLSAGQRQLVAFARAAAADPRILILDEATSNVDVHTEAGIERGLRRLLAGRTAIVIAHRLSTIRDAGRIVVLDHGRIAEQGTHDELLAADGAYARLYRDWAEQAAA